MVNTAVMITYLYLKVSILLVLLSDTIHVSVLPVMFVQPTGCFSVHLSVCLDWTLIGADFSTKFFLACYAYRHSDLSHFIPHLMALNLAKGH